MDLPDLPNSKSKIALTVAVRRRQALDSPPRLDLPNAATIGRDACHEKHCTQQETRSNPHRRTVTFLSPM